LRQKLKDSNAIAIKQKFGLQPLSSFSLDPDQALYFTSSEEYRVLIACDVPVGRILSTARTGYGCLEEAECVVIGLKDEEYAMGVTDTSRLSIILRALIDFFR